MNWEPLGELGQIIRCYGFTKSDITQNGIPAIHYGQIYSHYDFSTTSTISFVSEITAEKLQKVNKGDVLITEVSHDFKDVGKTLVYLGEAQVVASGHITLFKPSDRILGAYLAYFFQTKEFEKSKRKYAKGEQVYHFYASNIAKINIPVPSIQEQTRIVAILDKFTDLIKEIKVGKELQQKKLKYYNNKLFVFDKEIKV